MSIQQAADEGSLSDLIDRFVGVPVLVIGDVMLDRYIVGSVGRISPEAPVPVLRMEREFAVLGGAGNVLRNLAALRTSASVIGVVGDDADGTEVCTHIESMGSKGSHILEIANRPTTVKVRYLAGSHQLLRVDREDITGLDDHNQELVQETIRKTIKDAKSVILSDYAKGLLEPQTIACVMTSARMAGLPVIVDPKNRDFRVYAGAELITPNRRELEEATDLPTQTDQEIETACRWVLEHCDIKNVLVTRSEHGMSLVTPAEAYHLPAEAKEVFDVSGAGDTVVALLGAGLGIGLPLREAARLANAAAGIVVGKLGTAVVQTAELKHALNTSGVVDTESKIVGLQTSVDRVNTWRHQGLKVGFTNGCFDLLHPGHLQLLRGARALCDRLVVAMNDDRSVKRLKGDPRPIQTESIRSALLAALSYVDMVVIFTEETPINVIAALVPDIVIKGRDYADKLVVGADIVERAGGRVCLIDLLEGYSTTRAISQLKQAANP